MKQAHIPFVYHIVSEQGRRWRCIDTIDVHIAAVDRVVRGHCAVTKDYSSTVDLVFVDGVPFVNGVMRINGIPRSHVRLPTTREASVRLISQDVIGSRPVVPIAGFDASLMSYAFHKTPLDPFGPGIAFSDYVSMRELAFCYAEAMVCVDDNLLSSALQPVQVTSLANKKPGKPMIEFRDRIAGWRLPRNGGIWPGIRRQPALGLTVDHPPVVFGGVAYRLVADHIDVFGPEMDVTNLADVKAMRFADTVHWLAEIAVENQDVLQDSRYADHAVAIIAAAAEFTALHRSLPDTLTTKTAALGMLQALADATSPLALHPSAAHDAKLTMLSAFVDDYVGSDHFMTAAPTDEDGEAVSLMMP